MTDNRILLGRIAGAFGVRGEVRLKSFCADPAAIIDYGPLTLADGRPLGALTLTGATSGALTARVAGVATPEQADALRGQDLFADRTRLPALGDDEFYHSDLIGLQVMDTGGTRIGQVQTVVNHGAGDILDIRLANGAELMLPFTRAAVPTVDLAGGRIIVDPPDSI
jgi:16S rRNA processing protein RimM